MTIGQADFFLGLPAWAFPGWKDRYFTDAPSRLSSYATVFDTVEGNTTFYRTPDRETVLRWRDSVARHRFRFCFKLPREVTHETRPDMKALGDFLATIEPLAGQLGPLLVQFPASVAPADLDRFQPVFEAIRESQRLVIEVRHPAFFEEPALLEGVLERFGAGRVILDSRPIFEGDRGHPELLDALHEKPNVPVLPEIYNDVTLIRLILHPDLASNRPWLDAWSVRVAGYLAAGVTTYMMIHCPNNLHCPPLAREFHAMLAARVPGLSVLPHWPVPQPSLL